MINVTNRLAEIEDESVIDYLEGHKPVTLIDRHYCVCQLDSVLLPRLQGPGGANERSKGANQVDKRNTLCLTRGGRCVRKPLTRLTGSQKPWKTPIKPDFLRRRDPAASAGLPSFRGARGNLVCSYLASLGLSYRFQQGFYTPFYRIADFYLPTLNIIIELDGPCHDPEKDKSRDQWFERVRGIMTLRLTNDQVERGDFATINDFVHENR